MDQSARRKYLIQKLLDENREYNNVTIPESEDGQRKLLRGLMNIRMPGRISDEFIEMQDKYLREEIYKKGITNIEEITPEKDNLYLWQGDITTIKCDAIVNAANSGMTGCYVPNHNCIDNCIHTFAGIRLRNYCADLMRAQGHEEPTGHARITPGYNLPAKYVIHTVGPIISGEVSSEDEEMLASCYRSCLETALDNDLDSLAFCCISTGVFHFPNELAAEIAVRTVKEYGSGLKVIFNVWKDIDYDIYKRLLK